MEIKSTNRPVRQIDLLTNLVLSRPSPKAAGVALNWDIATARQDSERDLKSLVKSSALTLQATNASVYRFLSEVTQIQADHLTRRDFGLPGCQASLNRLERDGKDAVRALRSALDNGLFDKQCFALREGVATFDPLKRVGAIFALTRVYIRATKPEGSGVRPELSNCYSTLAEKVLVALSVDSACQGLVNGKPTCSVTSLVRTSQFLLSYLARVVAVGSDRTKDEFSAEADGLYNLAKDIIERISSEPKERKSLTATGENMALRIQDFEAHLREKYQLQVPAITLATAESIQREACREVYLAVLTWLETLLKVKREDTGPAYELCHDAYMGTDIGIAAFALLEGLLTDRTITLSSSTLAKIEEEHSVKLIKRRNDQLAIFVEEAKTDSIPALGVLGAQIVRYAHTKSALERIEQLIAEPLRKNGSKTKEDEALVKYGDNAIKYYGQQIKECEEALATAEITSVLKEAKRAYKAHLISEEQLVHLQTRFEKVAPVVQNERELHPALSKRSPAMKEAPLPSALAVELANLTYSFAGHERLIPPLRAEQIARTISLERYLSVRSELKMALKNGLTSMKLAEEKDGTIEISELAGNALLEAQVTALLVTEPRILQMDKGFRAYTRLLGLTVSRFLTDGLERLPEYNVLCCPENFVSMEKLLAIRPQETVDAHRVDLSEQAEVLESLEIEGKAGLRVLIAVQQYGLTRRLPNERSLETFLHTFCGDFEDVSSLLPTLKVLLHAHAIRWERGELLLNTTEIPGDDGYILLSVTRTVASSLQHLTTHNVRLGVFV